MSRKHAVRIALLVMLALIVCLISGCSQNTEPEATGIVTETVTETPAAESAEAPAEEAVDAPSEEVAADPVKGTVDTPSEEPVEAEAVAAPVAQQERVLLATVNGEEIWSDNQDLAVAMDYYIYQADTYGMDTESPDVIAMLQQYAMEYAQETAVIYQKAAELGLSATEEDKAQAEAAARTQWIDELDEYAISAGLVDEDASDDDKAAARADAANQLLESYGYDEAKYVAEVS